MAQAPETVVVQIDLEDVGNYPDNGDVGAIWEVAINGQGYMLDHGPDVPQYDRGAVSLIPERLATTETPFSESVDRYSFYAQSLFAGGEGQVEGNRSDSDPRKYRDGEGVDPFEPGTIRLGPAGTEEQDWATATPRLVTVGSEVYGQSASGTLTRLVAAGTSPGSVSISDTTGAVTISGLTSDGTQWYAASTRSVTRGTTSDPAADWSAIDAHDVQWAAGRICAAAQGAGSSTPNVFTTLNDSGAEESVGGHIVFPAGVTVHLGGTAGGSYFFEAAGDVYAWRLGLNEADSFYTPFSAWELPKGADFVGMFTAAGSVWIQMDEADGDRVLYRGLPDNNGTLQVVRVADTTADAAQGTGLEWDNKVLVTWPGSSLAAVGLRYGGFAKWSGELGTGVLYDVTVVDGIPVVSDVDGKVWFLDGGLAATGWFSTPVFDAASSLDKVWDDVTVSCEPLAAGESIAVEYTTDRGASYTSLGTVSGAGVTRYVFDLDLSSQSLGLRVTLTGPGTSTPVLSSVSLRTHPAGLADQVLVLPVVCGDEVEGLNGQIVPGSVRGRGAELARQLELMAGTRVRVQDVDWPFTQQSHIFEVTDVRAARPLWLSQQRLPKFQTTMVLTMRKKLTR